MTVALTRPDTPSPATIAPTPRSVWAVLAQTSTNAMLCIRLTLWSAVVITSVSTASGAPSARIFTSSLYSGSPYHHTDSGVATSNVIAVAGSAHAALILMR